MDRWGRTCSSVTGLSPCSITRSGRRARAAGRWCSSPARPGSARRAWCATFAADAHARVLLAACDDLRAPRPLGPLRDAHRASARLRPDVFAALLGELAREPPTLLVVEDVHWADDATLDVLGLCRAPDRDAAGASSCSPSATTSRARCASARGRGERPSSPARRCAAQPRCGGAAQRGQRRRRRRAARGSPAATRSSSPKCSPRRPDACPRASPTRCSRAWAGLSADCRAALDQLSVVPSAAGAELFGLRPRGAGRGRGGRGGRRRRRRGSRSGTRSRAAPSSRACPALRRRLLNAGRRARVATVRAAGPRAADAPCRRGRRRRAILEFGPRAAREAAARGLAPPGAGPPRDAAAARATGSSRASAPRCSTTTAGSSTTRTASPTPSRAGRAAAEGFAALGDDAAVGRCLVRLSRHLLLFGDTDEAERCARARSGCSRSTGATPTARTRSLQRGAILAMTGEAVAASARWRRRAGSPRARRRDRAVPELPRRSRATTRRAAAREHRGRAARPATTSTPAAATRTWPRSCRLPARSTSSTRACARASSSHASGGSGRTRTSSRRTAASRCCAAGAGTRRSPACARWSRASRIPEPRCSTASRGTGGCSRAAATQRRSRCWPRRGSSARRQGLLVGLSYAGLAYAEWAWLAGRADVARGAIGAELLHAAAGAPA